ncbi:MAG: amino acid carrier protein, partial [Clostridia bacterium]|nr:amino acid carrier protein [Clostridia bacterium]
GGPFYYIEKGLGRRYKAIKSWKWLGKMFAFFGALAGLMGIGTITQINGITSAAGILAKDSDVLFTIGEKNITVAVALTGAVVTILAALVVIGGIKRISSVSEVVVPFMAVAYVILVVVVLICNAAKIPSAVKMVVVTAFDTRPVMGAIAGVALKVAVQKGIGRGIFSNEAGLGSAPIAAAAAKTKDPVRQGLVTMTGTFIDTIVICTMTGLSIVTSGAWDPRVTGEALEGFDVTAYAWRSSLPWSEELSVAILAICLAFFAFTTIIGWDYYSERCMEYLIGGHKKGPLMAFKIVYILAVAVGPYLTVSMVWTTASIFNALMALPNLVALLLLGGVVGKETRAYFKKLKKRETRQKEKVS